MQAIIELRNLTKNYGRSLAVNHLSLKVDQGEIFGFIGPNGAGKTSTIRILATLLQPTAGDALVAGHSVLRDPLAVRGLIGYMPDFFGIYSDLTVTEYLDFFAGCFHIQGQRKTNLLADLLDLVDLAPRSEDLVDNLSRGMKQRLSLARTLIHDPSVLILDEPASGLDPRARVEIRELLRELARMGKTIFFSSHILSDVSEICTRIGIIEGGELVVSGTPAELQKQQLISRRIRIAVLSDPQLTVTLLKRMPGVSAIAEFPNPALPNLIEIDFSGTLEATAGLLAELAAADLQLVEFKELESSLEEVYLRATQGQIG